MRTSKFSNAQIVKAILDVKAGRKTVSDIVKEFDIKAGTFYSWKKNYDAGGFNEAVIIHKDGMIIDPIEIQQLKDEIHRLTEENKLLRHMHMELVLSHARLLEEKKM